MDSRITELLGTKYPLLQGGMAWVANHKIAAAVSNAGGLGIIAGGSAPADAIREEIVALRALTDRPFGVNIMLMSPFAGDLAKLVLEEQVPVVTTGAGSPDRFIDEWKNAGIKVIPVIASVSQAIKVERAGADAVVAEGQEAGGHIGELTTMALLPQVVDAVSIPVIGAGGIGDARGFAAALMLGAEGVQVGTALLLAEECDVHENFKQEVISARDTGTIVTGRFGGGHPVRQLKTRFSRDMASLEKKSKDAGAIEEKLAGSLYRAVKEGDLKEGSFMAGQIAGLLKEVRPAKEIIDEMVLGAVDRIKNFEKKAGVNLG